MHYLVSCTLFSTIILNFIVSFEPINPYLKRFSRVNFNKDDLIKNHERTKRDIQPFLELKFSAHEKMFDLKLKPVKSKFFQKDFIEIGSQEVPIKDFQLYEGHLADEPQDSHVTGTIIDGIFTGIVKSKQDGVYYIEPAKKYYVKEQHSIVYHEKDVLSKPRTRRSSEDADVGCGISKDKIREALLKEQRRFGKQEIKPIKGSVNFDESESFKYSREANLRKKRQTETFPDGRNVCNLYLKIDPYLYDTIFNNEGGQDDILTRNYLIYYLEKQVESLNSIFNQITTSGFFQNLRFITENIRIYKLSDCPNLGSPENKICENYLDAITLLNHVSLNNFDQYCLSYTFTSRDFADGTLGLAWLASADGTIGGICQKRATVINETKSLNSGIVSLVSFGSRVPERVNQITFAHEVGHSLGAKHDPETSECQPGGSSGNFIMFSRATSGNQPNNDIFSSCSIQDVNSVFINLFTSKNCLKSASDINAICGNGIIENEEVCDPGDSGLTRCCAADCRSLISGECDPSQGGCCDPSTCRFYTNEKVCLIGNDCRGDVKCTNLNAKCPVDQDINFKEDLSLCNENSQVCRNGSCTDSICDLYELKQCYIVGNLSDPKVNKSELCLLACTGAKTSNQCKLTRDIADFGGRSYSLRPGSSCSEMNGYCDIFSKCRAVNSQNSLTRLASTLLSNTTITIEDIATFATTYWWAILLLCIAFLAINGIIILCIILHMNSDNPEKSLGYSFKQTLRNPIQVCGRKPDNLKRNPINFSSVRLKSNKTPTEVKASYDFDEKTSDSSEVQNDKTTTYTIKKIRKNPR